MKKLSVYFIVCISFFTACNKSDTPTDTLKPIVAANDTAVSLPFSNAVILYRNTYTGNQVSYRLVSGPVSNNNILFRRNETGDIVVSGLSIAGTYQFEVSVTELNQTKKDYMTVTVAPGIINYTSEIILSNLTWQGFGLYGSETRIDNFYTLISGSNKPFKIYIKSVGPNSTNSFWDIVAPFELDPNHAYYSSYFQKAPNTRIVSEYAADFPDVFQIKIVY